MSALDEVDSATREILERFGFDAERFDILRGRVASGELTPVSNVLRGRIEPPEPGDVIPLPVAGDRGYEEAHAAGAAALRSGRIAHVVLAGGMATRFGGVVKAVVDVFPGRSFLDLALSATAALERSLGARIPTCVMSSFATDEVLREHVRGLPVPVPHVFPQLVSLRLEPDGSLFHDDDGQPSLYGPGHGDLFDALRLSGTLADLREAGVEHILVANVDNLGARVDPVVAGMHLLAARPYTAEVAQKEGDSGGAPARVDGVLRLVEGPCFPPDYDQEQLPVFNTNTGLIRLDAIAEPVELSWLVVRKQVDGRRAIQLERLYHELSALVPTTFLQVPRGGPQGRFFPVKEPADLERVRTELGHPSSPPP
jgi:UTP--glucose-1-phosphate uridylyltransferase